MPTGDPGMRLLEYAGLVVIRAELLDSCRKTLDKVSTDTVRNARKDVLEAIERLQAFERLLNVHAGY